MEPFQQRVIDEKSELDIKLANLDKFLTGEIYKTLPFDEQARLHQQVYFMTQYSKILGERITAFKHSKSI